MTHPHETEQDVFVESEEGDSQQGQQQHLDRVYPAQNGSGGDQNGCGAEVGTDHAGKEREGMGLDPVLPGGERRSWREQGWGARELSLQPGPCVPPLLQAERAARALRCW